MPELLSANQQLNKMNEHFLAANMEATVENITNDDLLKMDNLDRYDIKSENYKRGKKLHDLMVDQLMISGENSEQLQDAYSDLLEEAESKKAQLQADANRTGKEKVKNDFFGTKRKKAKAQLREIERKKLLYEDAKQAETNPKYAKNYKRQLDLNRFHRSHKLNRACKSAGPFAWLVKKCFNGSNADRRKTTKNVYYDTAVSMYGEKVSFPGHKGSTLKGYCFTPKGKWNNKVVILYTGSGEPGYAEGGMGEVIEEYVTLGFKVYQVDYRGYGESGTKKSNGKFKSETFTEKHFYEDGNDIYTGVRKREGVKPNNIILHGFSMGAPIASHVAASIAERNRRKELVGKKEANPENYIGGLCMDSPMSSMKFAAGNGIIGSLGAWAEGKYSAEDHLAVLSDIQPDLPVLFVSGDANGGDQLPLGESRTHEKFHFNKTTVGIMAGTTHEACHVNDDVIKETFLS